MISDATRTIANGQRLQADVCIVGAGPAGITLALGLMERGLAVLVLEAGGRDLVPAIHTFCKMRGEDARQAVTGDARRETPPSTGRRYSPRDHRARVGK